MKVVVADDSSFMLATMTLALQSLGHVVAVANDGVEALEAIERIRPELAFIDLDMPYLDGYGVARAVRANPRLRDMHLVAFSGFGSPRVKEGVIACGFDQHVTKPISLEQLAAIVDGASAGLASC